MKSAENEAKRIIELANKESSLRKSSYKELSNKQKKLRLSGDILIDNISIKDIDQIISESVSAKDK